MDLKCSSLIQTDHYCYFRPSYVKAKREIEYELKDYTKYKNHVSSETFQNLIKVDHSAPRVRYVSKRLQELDIQTTDENYTSIAKLLGLEHKYSCSLTEVEDFITLYQNKIQDVQKELRKFKNQISLKLRMGSRFEEKIIPLLGELSESRANLETWQQEKVQVLQFIQFIKNKLLLKSSI